VKCLRNDLGTIFGADPDNSRDPGILTDLLVFLPLSDKETIGNCKNLVSYFTNKLCGRPPQYVSAPCKLTFDLLTLKVMSESRVTWLPLCQF